MKTDVRSSVAALLLAVSASAAAQGPLTPQPDAQPPQPSAPPQTAPPPQAPVPAPQAPAPVQQAPAPVQPSAPAPQQQPVYPTPPASSVPQSPPPPSYPPSQRYQYPSTQQSPPPPQYPPTPAAPATTPPAPARQYGQPQWVHSESTVSDSNGNAYGFQYHPLVFHVDGGTTITERQSENYFKNGWNAGAGFTWYPTSQLPLGLRIDGTYNEFGLRNQLLQQASESFNTTVDRGTQKMWGGDADLELDLHLSPYMRAYLLGGGGLYRQQTTYRDTGYTPGFGCGFFGCGPGYYRYTDVVARETSAWHFAPNAGFGLEFYLGPRTSFFAEARYMRLNSNDGLKWDYIPVKFGLRF